MQRQGKQHSPGGASGIGNLAQSDTGAGGGMPIVQGGFHAQSGSQYMHPAAGHMMGHSAPANMGHHQWAGDQQQQQHMYVGGYDRNYPGVVPQGSGQYGQGAFDAPPATMGAHMYGSGQQGGDGRAGMMGYAHAAQQHQMMMHHHHMQQQQYHNMGGDTGSVTSATSRSESESDRSIQSDRSSAVSSGVAQQQMQQQLQPRPAQQQPHAVAQGSGGWYGGQRGMPAAAAAGHNMRPQAADAEYNARYEEVEIKSGWLFKKAESSWGWRKRWFVLYKSRLAYFSSPDARGVVKTIALNDPRVETVVEALPHELEFRINSYGRSFHLKAVSDGERAQWIFALQLVIKDGLIAHEKYAELARKQQSRRNKADKAGAAGAAGGATMAGGGYANVVSGGSSQGSRDSSARGSGSASAANYQQQALGMFSTTQLKRKLAEALPFDVARGAPTPALSLSNPASREGSMHGSHHGDFRSRSCETSQHNFLEMGSQSGRRSRDGSSHDVHADYGMPEQQNPDDSGKRVRKDGETLSKTLSVAGQQAVELTMRYLAHMLLRGEGPFQVHEVVWVIHKAYLNLIRREIDIPHLSSQFLTSVVLRGLLMKQQMGNDKQAAAGSQSWPEVHVNTESVEFHKFSQHITHCIVASLENHIEVAPEALVLPPILLPLLLLIEVIQQHGWPPALNQEAYSDELISAVSSLAGNETGGPVPSSALAHRGRSDSVSSSRTPASPASQGRQSPMEPRSPADAGVASEVLQTSRSFQDLLEGMDQMGGPSSSGSFTGFGTAAARGRKGKVAGGSGPAAAGGTFAASVRQDSVKHESMPSEANGGGMTHAAAKAEGGGGGEEGTAKSVSPPPQMDETGGLELHDHDLVGLPEDLTGVLGEHEGDIWDVLVDPDGDVGQHELLHDADAPLI